MIDAQKIEVIQYNNKMVIDNVLTYECLKKAKKIVDEYYEELAKMKCKKCGTRITKDDEMEGYTSIFVCSNCNNKVVVN